ncbi:hypothetical protein PPYR_02547 [Photinus pyralis]|uniref:ornithine decarboxylase n=1 Tax=Photinus pyralis TaxID=7054 RepID=A0A5N4B7J8_PHOPY|nr:ornithine decarboxylase 2-like [Photinus pyralis]KAB0805577.1 hypothetical protein PPYR_02547 [Photinus pyralis]
MNFENNFQSVDVYKNDISVTRIIAEKILQRKSTAPFYVCDLREIFEKHSLWTRSLPRVKPFFAVKANNCANVLKMLADVGVNFDCASKNEIDQILSLGVHPERIIYAHPVKPPNSIEYAKEVGVKLITFDNAEELSKMKKLYSDVRAVLRIRSDAKESILSYGSKFGCNSDNEAARLIQLARTLDVDLVGVSFHVGTECHDLEAFSNAIQKAHAVFSMAKLQGFNPNVLDIGGGFTGVNDQWFKKIAQTINNALELYFPNESMEIIAEPGSFFVNSSFTLACNVLSKKLEMNKKLTYYINDGIHGSFRRDYCFNVPVTVYPLKKYYKRKLYKSIIYGSSSAIPDVLTSDALLPVLEIGDWLLFLNMGAYCTSLCTFYDGFSGPDVCYVVNPDNCSQLSFTLQWPTINEKELPINDLNTNKKFISTFDVDKVSVGIFLLN